MTSPRCVSAIFEVKFKNKLSPLEILIGFRLFKEITGKKTEVLDPAKSNVTGGFNFTDPQSKLTTIVEVNRIAISTEIENNTQEDVIKKSLKVLYSNFEYKELDIQRVGVRTMWVLPYSKSFTDLMTHYKNNFYNSSNPLVSESTDVAVSLSLEDHDNKVNFNSGPMKPEQLKTVFLKFGTNVELPHDFIFADIDRYTTSLTNKETDLTNYIRDSIEYGSKKMLELEQIINK